MEGKNSVSLTDCAVTGNMAGTYGDSTENIHNVMLYQSTSGDADVGPTSFAMTGGSLTALAGDMFYITNTQAEITLNGVDMAYAEGGALLRAEGNDAARGWGTPGANGADVDFTAVSQVLEGDVVVDSISTLDFVLSGGSAFNGTINIVANAQGGAAADENAHVVIGEGCTLLPNCRIDASRVGAGTRVESSVLLSCEVGANATVGPFAYIRPQTRVGDGCRVGDFVELKNATIGEGTKISHLTYVGDSDLGRDINLGCGVVFVNYDGKEKHRTTVDDKAFIGCNVNLVSPVHVGREAYIAAGSTVTEDVPGGALAIARQRQTVRPGWVDKRKEEGKL